MALGLERGNVGAMFVRLETQKGRRGFSLSLSFSSLSGQNRGSQEVNQAGGRSVESIG